MAYSNVQETLIDAASAAVSFSTTIDVQNFDSGSIQVVFSGLDAADASVDLLASIDRTNFETLLTAVTTLTVSSGNHVYNITDQGFNELKVTYDEGSVSTGTVSVYGVRKSRR